jgi:WD40 repeat protein
VRVWDLDGTAAPQVLTGHVGPVWGVAVSADGRIVVGGDGRTVRVWDLAGTAAPRVLTCHDDRVKVVALSADGQTVVSGGDGYGGSVRVWDLAGNQEQARWMTDAMVLTVAFSTAVIVAGDIAGQAHALQLNICAATSG